MMPAPSPAIQRTGSLMISDIATIDQPSAQITCTNGTEANAKFHAKRRTVSSRNINQRPRVQKNRVACGNDFPRATERYAPAPASRKNTGAQMCVMTRVKNNAPYVLLRSSGEKRKIPRKPQDGQLEKYQPESVGPGTTMAWLELG